MLKCYFLSFFLITITISSAQITVTSSDMPNAGDSILVSEATTTTANLSLTGPGYSWDFSSLVPVIQRYEKFDAPNSYPSVYPFVFFASSYGQENYQDTGTVFPGLSIAGAYDFFKETVTGFRQVGIGYLLNGTIPLLMQYSKPDTIYDFPMNYADTSECDYKFATPAISIVPFYYSESGHRKSVVDGWGDLTTPFGTFPTLRVRSVITAVDSIYLDTLGFGQAFPVPTRIEYKWIGTGKKIPLLEIDATDLGGTETVTGIVYRDSVRASVPQVGIAEHSNATDLSVYPNPAGSQATVQFDLAAAAHIQVSIVNVLGQTVAVIADESAPAGKQLINIDLGVLGLSPGIYGIRVGNNQFNEVRSIVVTR